MSENTQGFQPFQTEPAEDSAPEGYVSRAELERILAERDKAIQERDVARAAVPQAMVPANAGGPGNDNHQRSWSLVEQELAARGESLDHWE